MKRNDKSKIELFIIHNVVAARPMGESWKEIQNVSFALWSLTAAWHMHQRGD